MVLTIESLTEIYPDHIWIDLSKTGQFESKIFTEQLRDRDYNLSQVDLNQLCMVAVKKWLGEIFDLEIKSVFPCTFGGKDNLEFISQLVNGFALQLGKTRLVFIPSQAIDLTEVEIPQEWVDLPNWAADYYIPIQVDVEGKYLHLWTFISHYNLKNSGEFDRVLQNYEIPDDVETKNLDVLFTACELHSLGELTPKRAAIEIVPPLVAADATKLIEQLQQHRSASSPRLKLSFNQWGAILSDEQFLERYCYKGVEIDLGEWLKFTKMVICDGFELMGHFINPPQTVPVLYPERIPSLHVIQGVQLGSDIEISEAITHLYHQQTELLMPEGSISIDATIPLLKSCKTPEIWWRAAEYLWTVQPEHPFLITRITQLETKFAGQSIALMISMIPTLDDRTAVMIRLYPSDHSTYLPFGLQMTIQDDLGINLLTDPSGNAYVATAGGESQCIQHYFTMTPGERFVSCISLDNVKILKNFTFNNPIHNQLLNH
jgi:Protein of unknown function (DUF1822)